MVIGSRLNNNQRKILVYRGYTENAELSATEWLPPSQFRIGHSNSAPLATSTGVDNPIPILNGTVVDGGEDVLTGVDGGEDSTTNLIRYRPGGGVTDNEAQNLNVNDTDVNKEWYINGLTFDLVKDTGLWLYFHTSTISKIESVKVRFVDVGDDSYYEKVVTGFVSGWNWVDCKVLQDLPKTGTGATPTRLNIIITTNNATDEWDDGDVVYDLLRQWQDSDTYKNFETGYPSVNVNTFEATTRSYLNSLEAVGFNINAMGSYNEDTTKKLTSLTVFPVEGKGTTDEIAFIEVDRVI